MNIADYKGVWVFAEQRDGELQKVALELLGKGRELADKLKVDLTAVLLGSDIDDAAEELTAYGADKVLYADSPLLKHYTTDGYTKVIVDLVEEKKTGNSTYRCKLHWKRSGTKTGSQTRYGTYSRLYRTRHRCGDEQSHDDKTGFWWESYGNNSLRGAQTADVNSKAGGFR